MLRKLPGGLWPGSCQGSVVQEVVMRSGAYEVARMSGVQEVIGISGAQGVARRLWGQET